ncbi:tyrosine-type recombinase/integrase [Bifidobacterium biavatii]|uniref:Integrase n=1 Tax=Bifidobacterium biavatii DSM 23969 TaxID=1437608 RepID=A0A086Z5X2_9BIFI|nr:site-specific integrase [Bifidobacterium biavatii]KFI41922.1 integrase [Bifidobacterium biavatii DSM 23969]
MSHRNPNARRRAFGCIIERKRPDGSVFALEARYTAAVTGGKRITKNFKPTETAEARWWLDAERDYVDKCRRGLETYKSPSERSGKVRKLTFGVFADAFLENHRAVNGEELRGGTKRNLRNNVKHLKEAFGDVKLSELTPELIEEWYYGEHLNGDWQFRSECTSLKMILREACKPGAKGAPPLLEENPFQLPIPPEPDAKSLDIPPVKPDELYRIYNAMPGYTRLAVYLAACVGGLRIGEVCGLQVGDFDLTNLTLTVRRSVNRGETDMGNTRLGKLKTKGSRRTVPIPPVLVPMIKTHIEDRPNPDSPQFFQAKRGDVLATSTLRNQFDRARKKANRPDLLFHTLRVTHSTQLMLHGGTLKEAMNALGHTREETTLKHYQRIVPEHQRDITDRTAAYMLSGDPIIAAAAVLTNQDEQASGNPQTSKWAMITMLLSQIASLMTSSIPEATKQGSQAQAA